MLVDKLPNLPNPKVKWYSLVPEITHKSHYDQEKCQFSHRKFYADREPSKKASERDAEIIKSVMSEYNTGDRLYPKVLMDRYECNLSTFKRVLHNLIEEGVAISKMGRGYFMI